jgi:hypothetical protein
MKINELNKQNFCGFFIGGVNGLFGGGGGMITVPLLQKELGYTQRQSHATAIAIIAPVCAAGVIAYIINGYLKLPVAIPVTLGNIVGGLVGAKLLGKLKGIWVSAIFIAIMAAAGVRMIIG